MDIYIVNDGDDIYSIANKFDVSVSDLILQNGLSNSSNLVPGQAVVITYPSQTHTVQEGDTLGSIANIYGVTLMQLLRNNPFLSEREFIYPGETIIISYNTNGLFTINGYAYPYIDHNTLIKTLPFLTYLSVFNYGFSEEGRVIRYDDDTKIIQLAKDYGVAPLMMISSLSPKGEPNAELNYEILLSEEYSFHLVENILSLLHSTGYSGVNMLLSSISVSNQKLYLAFLTKASKLLINEGYQLYITINPELKYVDDIITFEQLDYTNIGQLVNGITFLHYVWGTISGPPSPISSIDLITVFINYIVTLMPPEKITIGTPLLGYDWELPYLPNRSNAYSLTLHSVIALANDIDATIQFDETSQSPYFYYRRSFSGVPVDHIVWFIDARSINALDALVLEYGLAGSGIWNIMIYYQQMWTLINSQYEINKILPDNLWTISANSC